MPATRSRWTSCAAAAEIGAPEITAAVIANIETGRRANVSSNRRRYVTIDELLTFAYALDVAPIRLLVPVQPGYYRVVKTPRPDLGGLGNALVDRAEVREWIRGNQPLLNQTDVHVYFSEVDEETFRKRFGHGSNWNSEETTDGR